MAGRTYFSAEELTEATFTNTTYSAAFVSLTIGSPPANSDLIILWSCSTQRASGSSLNFVKLDDGTIDYGEFAWSREVSSEWRAHMGVARIQTGPSPSSITLNIKARGSSTAQGTIDDGHIVVIVADSADEYAEDATFSTSANTPQDIVSLTFTPATTGDYYIIATGECGTGNTAVRSEILLDVDGTDTGAQEEFFDSTSEKTPWMRMEKVNLDNSSHTIKLQGRRTTAGGTAVTFTNCRIYAIRADTLDSDNYASAARGTTTSTSDQDNATMTFTPEALDYLVINTGLLDASSTSFSAIANSEQGGADLQREMIFRTMDAAEDEPTGIVTVRTLSASSTNFKTVFRSENASGTAGFSSQIAVLQLEASPTGGGIVPFRRRIEARAA